MLIEVLTKVDALLIATIDKNMIPKGMETETLQVQYSKIGI